MRADRATAGGVLLRGLWGAIGGWIFTAVYWTPIIVLTLLTGGAFANETLGPAGRGWGKGLLWLCGVRVVLDNPTTLRGRRGRVVLLNHASNLDIIWCASLAPTAPNGIGKRGLLLLPFINLVFLAFRMILIDRSNPDKAHATLKRAAERIRKERISVVVSPEGTRSLDGRLGPFKKGAFHLAMEAGVPIYPVVAHGGYRLWPKQQGLPRPGTLHVRFLEAIPTEHWSRAELPTHIANVRAAMARALAEMQAADVQDSVTSARAPIASDPQR